MFGGGDSRIRVIADFSEADAVVSILEKRQGMRDVTAVDWQGLFATEPYRRLKKRESEMNRTFTDEDFKGFVLTGDLLSQYAALRSTVTAWKQVDLDRPVTMAVSPNTLTFNSEIVRDSYLNAPD
jgi:hypothetical protein